MSSSSMKRSARIAPACNMATSAPVALEITSARKLPMFVSFVRIDEKFASRRTLERPTTTSIPLFTISSNPLIM
eukprot:CCRYP_008651-RC/>CCRYP_008651-RC protein AED:0.48 eAED:1.00 QI:0/0/0/1/0/0/2/0/73